MNILFTAYDVKHTDVNKCDRFSEFVGKPVRKNDEFEINTKMKSRLIRKR